MYRELSDEELATLNASQIQVIQERRERVHADWHEEFSGEYDDCPFQNLGPDWLTTQERAALQARGIQLWLGY